MPAPPDSPSVLSVDDLHFSWPQGPLFQGLSFRLPAGLSAVVGDDGSGKTTLLKLLGGELAPMRGGLTLNGEPLRGQPHADVFWVDPQTQAHDAISAANYLDGLGQHHPLVRADVLAALVQGFSLQPHLDKPLYMLSTGSKRKVWLSAAFASGAALTLIDNPFAALDAPSIRFLKELLQEAASHRARTWLLADHTVPEGLPLARVIAL
jgi:ABC-type multidrug transport system ATPase subunit